MAEDDHAAELALRLRDFLSSYLGEWPPTAPFLVASARARDLPGWDGEARPLTGVETPTGAVVSVPARHLDAARALAAFGRERFADGIGGLLGLPGAMLRRGIFRAAARLVDLGEQGIWLPSEDPRLPEWLRAFPGEVLVALDGGGGYAAGVGLKHHSDLGQEIAVGTEERHRGKGLARVLVAQASRRIYDDGAVATYLHAPDNVASGRVAEAAGFPDLGWRVLGLQRGG